MKKRMLAVMLTLVMLLALLPAMPLAAASAYDWDVFVHPRSFTLDVGVRYTSPINMIFVEGGTFTKGWEDGTPGPQPEDTVPVPGVSVGDFWISDSVVTMDLWNAVMGATQPGEATRNNVWTAGHWYHANEFLARMYVLTGMTFHLPTEAQFEFAAKGGLPGQALGHNLMRYPSTNNRDFALGQTGGGFAGGAARNANPNILGLYDLIGMEEWVWNDWHNTIAGGEDPTGPPGPIHQQKTRRGGVSSTGSRELHSRLIRSIDGTGHAFRLVIPADMVTVPPGMVAPINIPFPWVDDRETPNGHRDPRWITGDDYVLEGHFRGFGGGAMKLWEDGTVVMRPHNFNGLDPGDIVGQWYTFNNYGLVVIPDVNLSTNPNAAAGRILIPYVWVSTEEGHHVVSVINDRNDHAGFTNGPDVSWPDIHMFPTGRLQLIRETELIERIETLQPRSLAPAPHFLDGITGGSGAIDSSQFLWYGGTFAPIEKPTVPSLVATENLEAGVGIVDAGHYLIDLNHLFGRQNTLPMQYRGNDLRLVDGPDRGWWMGYGWGGIHTYRRDIDFPGWHRNSVYTHGPGVDQIANPGLARGPWFTVNNLLFVTQNNEAGTNWFHTLYLIIPNADGYVTTDCVHLTMRDISFMDYERGDNRRYHLRYNEDIYRHTQDMGFANGPFGFTMGNTTFGWAPPARRICPGIPTGPGVDDFKSCERAVANCICPVFCRSCDSHVHTFSFSIFNNGNEDNASLSEAGLIRMWPLVCGDHVFVPMDAEITAVDQNNNDAMQFIRRNRQWCDVEGWQDYYINFDAYKNAPWQYITFTVTAFGETVQVLLINNLFLGESAVNVTPLYARVLQDTTRSFGARVLDREGNTVPNAIVTWELAEPVAGVSIDATTGLLTVGPVVAAGTEVAIIATYGGWLSGSATVTITAPQSLVFDRNASRVQTGLTFTYAGVTVVYDVYRVSYVANPYTGVMVGGINPAAARNIDLGNVHMMNITVPTSINGTPITNWDNSPILFESPWGGDANAVVGAPAAPAGGVADDWSRAALSRGWVVARAGMRGVGAMDADGQHWNKIPNPIADQKAALRYLHFNADRIPGNMDLIFVSGFSSGGSSAVTLGASGNSVRYAPYLTAIGAADARDDVFGVFPGAPVMTRHMEGSGTVWQRFWNFDFAAALAAAGLTPEQVYSLRVYQALVEDFERWHNSLNLTLGGAPFNAVTSAGRTSMVAYYRSYVEASLLEYLNHIFANGFATGGTTYFGAAAIEAYRGTAMNSFVDPIARQRNWFDFAFDNPSNPTYIASVDFTWGDWWRYHFSPEEMNPIEGKVRSNRFAQPIGFLGADSSFPAYWFFRYNGVMPSFASDTQVPSPPSPGATAAVTSSTQRSFGLRDELGVVMSEIGVRWLQEEGGVTYLSGPIHDGYREFESYEAMLQFQRETLDPIFYILADINPSLDINVDVAPHWWIRTGAMDTVNNHPVYFNLGVALKMHPNVESVDIGLVWDILHSRATFDRSEAFDWAHSLPGMPTPFVAQAITLTNDSATGENSEQRIVEIPLMTTGMGRTPTLTVTNLPQGVSVMGGETVRLAAAGTATPAFANPGQGTLTLVIAEGATPVDNHVITIVGGIGNLVYAEFTLTITAPYAEPVFGLIDFNNGHDGNASLANMGVIRIWTRLDGVNALVPYANLTVTAELPNGECAMQFVRINRIWNNPGYVNLIDVTKRDANWRYIDLTVTLSDQTVELLLINNLVTP